ncbi:MAG: glycoside hydrolase family 57 protein [Methanomicrobia archaeon]|nr:glycoside hydrolase family 57 protein [Methanomicrobia archaeon]
MEKKSICLGFEVHQPFRLRNDYFWSKRMYKRGLRAEDLFSYYFDDTANREIFAKVARKCYQPTNELLLQLLDEHEDFKVTFSITGVFLEQCEAYGYDELVEDFRALAATGRVEFLDQTYFHSLVGLYDNEGEFLEQVRLHRELMRDRIGVLPTFFENTELLYNNRIAKLVEDLGYSGILTEGVERVLDGRSPNYVYAPVGCKKLKVLLRHYQLTDDIGFRFSSKQWEEHPLTASKYATWLNATPGQCINLFMDYETFGEHHWADTGIFAFLQDFPRQVLAYELAFATPSEIVARYPAADMIDVRNLETISWADLEKDTSCFIGNTMQWACFDYLRWLEPLVKESRDAALVKLWRYLGISDHLYYMFTLGGASGDVHSYFSHFERSYDAFITLFSIIHDFDARLRATIQKGEYPLLLPDGRAIWSVKGLSDYLSDLSREDATALLEDLKPAELERWIRTSVGDEELANELRDVRSSTDLEDYEWAALQGRLLACLCKVLTTES